MIPAHPGLQGEPVYLDYNATTPLDPRVAEAMRPHLSDWMNKTADLCDRAAGTRRHPMTDAENANPHPPGDMTAAQTSVTQLELLAEKLGGRAFVTAVYGELVVSEGVTIIPVAKAGFGFGGGAGREVGAR
ncbi:hypothetical protein ACH492_27615 [Streptomyces sp. NPDC019443]|uniref:hypothetical protein n=1 Tax=Streptomyces sp. NPDC019443 TaxID=3365061 RepID=UPI003789EB4E